MNEKIANAFKGKNITVMGLGLLGRGIGDVKFLAECGANLIVTDLKTESQLAESVAQVREYPNVRLVLGEHREEDFVGRDMILKAAGVPLDSPFIKVARDSGTRIAMSAELFMELSGIPIIAVTGTRGKSTTTYLIHHVLKETTEGGNVLLGGNVRGVSNLQLLKEVDEHAIAVFELDSWQLQGFGESKRSPHIAVFTTFLDDHLNYYHGDKGAYFNDKANIFRYQHSGDTLVATPRVFALIQEHAKKYGYSLDQEVVIADASTLPEEVELLLIGEHNRMNASLAYEAFIATGLSSEEIAKGMASFHGVPGRLEKVGVTDQNVMVYNDNNATTPDATIAALKALGDVARKDIVLIMGGADKEIDCNDLAQTCVKYVKNVVMIPGSGTERVKGEFARVVPVEQAVDLREAVEKAFSLAKTRDVILFSPAFASFGLFTNEYDRNDQFMELIKHYVKR